MDKKYQVFISSTYDDLVEERQKVCDAVLTLYQIPIGMEMFSAADEEQWEIIKSHIDDTDFYVLIIGNRYGCVIEDGPDAGISYTEKEYNYAVSKGVPVLAYLIDENVPVKPSFVEKENVDKLIAFKEKVRQGREVVWWKSPDELATKVSQSLCKQILKDKRPGWVRAKAATDIEYVVSNTIFTNALTDGTFYHPYNSKQEDKNDGNSDINPFSKSSRISEDDDTEEKVMEFYRIYVEDIKPNILQLEVNTSQVPTDVLLQTQDAFDCVANYKVTGNKELVDSALSKIIRAKIVSMKYCCFTEEDYYQTFLNNHKSSVMMRKYVPAELSKKEIEAKHTLFLARSYEGANDQKAFQMYQEAFIQYKILRSMIDEYVNSL